MLNSKQQERLDCLTKALRERLKNRDAFKWALEVLLLERYAADPSRDPASWSKNLVDTFRRSGAKEEWMDALNVQKAYPSYLELWFEWTTEETRQRAKSAGIFSDSEIDRLMTILQVGPIQDCEEQA